MTHKFSVCLYQPDMPQNLGVIIRTAACLEFPLHIIKPLSFSMTDKRFKGAVMDYIDHCTLHHHNSWDDFKDFSESSNCRVILATTKTQNSIYEYKFKEKDIILFGKETAGVPDFVHNQIIEKITIPMNSKTRSLNLCLLYTSPSPRDISGSRMPSSA